MQHLSLLFETAIHPAEFADRFFHLPAVLVDVLRYLLESSHLQLQPASWVLLDQKQPP
jgi:hypothetical protein